jgi:delta-aminolevulinic acid dehydratase/porphobilinogen synthase
VVECGELDYSQPASRRASLGAYLVGPNAIMDGEIA